MRATNLKILFLNNYNYLRGGSERVFFEEMRMLEAAGHEAAVFSRVHELNVSSVFSDYFPPAIHTERLEISTKAFCTVKELIYSNKARSCLRKVISEYKPDIAHAHNIYGRLSASVLDELRDHGIPTVMTLHDFKLLCPSYLMLNKGAICEQCKGGNYHRAVVNKCLKGSYIASAVYALESWLNHILKKYDSVRYFISPSGFLRDKCIEFGWPADKIIHVPNFVDTQTIYPSEKPGRYLLYLGRLSREKGVGTLLAALGGLGTDTPLVVVGDGPERANLESSASERNLNVKFTGYQSGPALTEAMAQAQAVVMPSEWYENAPLSLLEAFAYGKPVIGARIGGIPEMIDDGVNGFLFDSGNANDLKDKIATFFALPEKKLIEMGRASRAKVEEQYSAEIHYTYLMRVYSAALGKQYT
jgi:glycosyltransferase involved in cell wall biosynthesis